MRSKVTVILLFLNVVLFYYIFHYEKPRISEHGLLEARRKVYGPEVATIDSITRTSLTGGPTIKIERSRDRDSWWLTQPYEWQANPNAVSRILNELQFLEHETSFSVADLVKSGRTLAEYGLEKPTYTLTFTSAGKTYVTKVGDNTEIANRLYLLSPDGTRIHVVSRSFADSIGQPLESLRSDSVFTIPIFEVRSLNIVNAAALKVRLQRDANSRWAFEAPIRARANKSKVEITINSLNTLRAATFPELSAADMERANLSSPTLNVTLEGNLRHETILIGAAVPGKTSTSSSKQPRAESGGVEQEYFAKIEGKAAIFTVPIPTSLLDDLRSAQEELRDPHVLDFDPHTVTGLTITAPNEPGLTLQQLVPGTPQWQVVVRLSGQAPLAVQADTALVDELLQKLHLLSKIKFLSDGATSAQLENWGFNRPERQIEINLSTGGGPKGTEPWSFTLQIGTGVDKEIAFAKLTNSQFVYSISPEILNAAPPLARYYRQRLLRTLPDGARIQGISLTEKDSGAPVYTKQLSEKESTWEIAVAKEPETKRKAIAALLTHLHTLRAKQFTADLFNPDRADTPEGQRPWKFRLDLSYSSPGGVAGATNPTSTLFLTERLGGNTQIAGTTEFGGAVFEITQELLDALFTLIYREKNDPGLPATISPNSPDPVSPPVQAPSSSSLKS